MYGTRLLLLFSLVIAVAASGCGNDSSESTPQPQGGGSTAEQPQQAPAQPAAPQAPHVALAAGPQHTCLVKSNGEAYCWGRNLDSELGDGTAQNRRTPVPVTAIKNVRQIDGGGHHSCAVVGAGEVWCWGRNEDGQLGSGTNLVETAPVQVPGITDAVQVSTGDDFTCALRRSKGVSCWGAGDNGRLGNGNTQDSRTPVEVAGLAGVKQIASGRSHTCAVTDAGEVYCWGANAQKQSALPGDMRESPRPAKIAGLAGISRVAAGNNTSCAVNAQGQLYCWGYNYYGMVGNGQEGSGQDAAQPVLVQGLQQVTEVDVGEYQTCAITQAGAAFCWGRDGYGNLGGAERGNHNTPNPVANVTDAQHIVTGGQHVCIMRQSGAVACWGRSESGQLGQAEISDPYHATDVIPAAEALTAPASTPATFPATAAVNATPMISTSQGFACALRSNGVPICWGSNGSGQHGNGTTFYEAGRIAEVSGITDAVEVSVGASRVCARRQGGTVACWGSLGRWNGSKTYVRSSRPLPLNGVTDAVELDLGGGSVCVRHQANTVSCLRMGQMQAVPGLTEVAQISVGYDIMCARRQNGEVWCWGRGSDGQLGNGEDSSSQTPVQVANLDDATLVTVGNNHACALRENGRIMCWGDAEDGQLGNGEHGDDLSENRPVRVNGISDATYVAAGMNHTCALRENGEVFCWGGNTFNQTGIAVPEGEERPEYVDRPTIVQPSTAPGYAALGPVQSLSCAWHLSCAFHETARVSCWGTSSVLGGGALGGLLSRRSPSPVPLTGLNLRQGGAAAPAAAAAPTDPAAAAPAPADTNAAAPANPTAAAPTAGGPCDALARCCAANPAVPNAAATCAQVNTLRNLPSGAGAPGCTTALNGLRTAMQAMNVAVPAQCQ